MLNRGRKAWPAIVKKTETQQDGYREQGLTSRPQRLIQSLGSLGDVMRNC